MFKRILTPLASLKWTVALIALSMFVIYAGTWAQIDKGIHEVEKQYFHSWGTLVDFSIFLPRKTPENLTDGGPLDAAGRGLLNVLSRVRIPTPGGYLIGVLMLVNLIAAHTLRFKFTPRRYGIILIHASLILLLVGEGIRSGMTVESQMPIVEGTFANWAHDIRHREFVVITPGEKEDKIVAVRDELIKEDAVISDPQLPFAVKFDAYLPNSQIQPAGMASPIVKATAGDGLERVATPAPVFSGTADAEKVDQPSAYVTLSSGGQALGTYLVSVSLEPQEVKVGDKTYQIALRFQRHYKPFEVHLIDARHDVYVGTNTPKNFASLVRLIDRTKGEDREVLISMNNPLRYAGHAFFQSQMNRVPIGGQLEQQTVLQVMQNPGWTIPYIACVVGAIGMGVHFSIVLAGFLRKRKAAEASRAEQAAKKPTPKRGKEYTLAPTPWWKRPVVAVPVVLVAICGMYSLSKLRPMSKHNGFDLQAFGNLPVLHQGRVQPLDSLARNSMKIMRDKEWFEIDGEKQPAIRWMIDELARIDAASHYRIFLVDHPEVKEVLKLDPQRKHYSFDEILAVGDIFMKQFQLAQQAPAADRSHYQMKILDLAKRLTTHEVIDRRVMTLHLAAPMSPGAEWKPLGEVAQASEGMGGTRHPSHEAFGKIVNAYAEGKPAEFNSAVSEYAALVNQKLPKEMSKVRFEGFFNRFDPPMQSLVMYLFVAMLAAGSWLMWRGPLARAAYWILLLTLVIHTFALIARIYISGRPPVTNLASSAIFIGWGASLLAAGFERFYRNAVASFVAGLVGFGGLIIFFELSLDGDTMAVLQAVLDTNFWLATHVLCVSLGYAATFLAGILGIVYIIGGVFTRNLGPDQAKDLNRQIYGVTCFAMLFSFVGTILGGIWGDQSWGRFWGWDPKENGALLIVLANALLLHARWGGMAQQRGVACLAVFGNIVTAWSWFGTNMLGVGLHSYGFMEGAFFWLLLFVFSQLVIIGIGNLPYRYWKSATLNSQISSVDRKVVPPARAGAAALT